MVKETAEADREIVRACGLSSRMLRVNRCKHARHVRRRDGIRRARTDRNADFFENRNKTRRRVTVEDSRMLLPSIAELQKQQQQQQHHRQSQSIVTMMMYL